MDADEIHFKRQEIRVERWKVLISALMSIVLLGLTWIVDSAVRERGAQLDREKQILQEKQKIYAKLGIDLNIIYIYVSDIGDYRSFKPLEVIAKKRLADRQFWSYLPYWSATTQRHYTDFMDAAFRTFVGVGKDAKLKATRDNKEKAFGEKWKSAWNDHFTGKKDSTVEDKYYKLVSSLLADTVSADVRKLPLRAQTKELPLSIANVPCSQAPQHHKGWPEDLTYRAFGDWLRLRPP